MTTQTVPDIIQYPQDHSQPLLNTAGLEGGAVLSVVCVGKTSLIRLTRALSTRVGAGTRQRECQLETRDPDACQDSLGASEAERGQ